MNNRVKYKDDLFDGLHLDKIEILEIPRMEDITINDAIEFYEINRYFMDGARSQLWNDEQYKEYIYKCRKLISLCKYFFNRINDMNILEIYCNVLLDYRSEFWDLFNDCKIYNKISSKTFDNLINSNQVSPFDLFRKTYKSLPCK